MIIIGIIGKKGSGKDTIADYLVKNHGFIRFAFGDKVKDVCKAMFNMTNKDFTEKNKEVIKSDWNISPRQALQLFGTDICREILTEKIPELKKVLPFKEGFWIRHFIIWYQDQLKIDPKVKVVISDIRFLDEAETVKTYNGIIWKVLRETKIYGIDQHISENQLDNFSEIDKIIENNNTIENLHKTLQRMINI